MFVMERVLAHRVGEFGQMEFLIEWRDYPLEEATWEPIASFCSEGARNTLRLYCRQHGILVLSELPSTAIITDAPSLSRPPNPSITDAPAPMSSSMHLSQMPRF